MRSFFEPDASIEEPRRSRRSNAGTLPKRLADYVVGVARLSESEPASYKEAIKSAKQTDWIKAMDEEYESHMSIGTWSLVPLPAGRQAIGSRWVFKEKKDASGQTARFKARLVAQGCGQRFGVDYEEVFAPVAMQPTLRVLLTVAGHRKYQVRHIDVKNAYLNGILKEEIYMHQPPGYSVSGCIEVSTG